MDWTIWKGENKPKPAEKTERVTGFRQARERAGVSQTEAARIFGVTQGAVSQWEAGTFLPRASMLVGIARTYGCTVDELLAPEKEEGGEDDDA